MFDSKALTEKFKKVVDENQATKEVEAFGMKLELRLLDSDEDMAVFDGLEGLEGANYLMAMKKDVIARSIYKVDGQEIPEDVELEGGKKMQRRLYLKETLLKKMPQMTLDKIHAAYIVMNVEFKNKIDGQIKFDNEDLINKFLEDEQAERAAAAAVDGLIQQEMAEQAPEATVQAEPAPAPAPAAPVPRVAQGTKMTSFANRPKA